MKRSFSVAGIILIFVVFISWLAYVSGDQEEENVVESYGIEPKPPTLRVTPGSDKEK